MPMILSGLLDDDDFLGDPDLSDEESDDPEEGFGGSVDTVVPVAFQESLRETLDPQDLESITFLDGAIDVATGEGADDVIGGAEDDVLRLGAGDDVALGGPGDDLIELGEGDDLARVDDERAENALFATVAFGDDTIRGDLGDDDISDGYGSNVITGNQGADILSSVDLEEGDVVTPDRIYAGQGNDIITVDQGDLVRTGPGDDNLIVDIVSLGDGDVEPARVMDYNPTQETVALRGLEEDLITPLPTGPGGALESPIKVVPFVETGGVSVTVKGFEVLRLYGRDATALLSSQIVLISV